MGFGDRVRVSGREGIAGDITVKKITNKKSSVRVSDRHEFEEEEGATGTQGETDGPWRGPR